MTPNEQLKQSGKKVYLGTMVKTINWVHRNLSSEMIQNLLYMG